MAFSMRMAWKICIEEIQAGQKNILCSPMSLNLALSMIALGAKGNTLDQILEALESADTGDVIDKAWMIRALSTKEYNDGDCLALANGLWLSNDYTFKSYYQQNLSTVFHAESKAVDFLNKSEEVGEEINLWVEEATKGLIKDVISKGSLDPMCVLVLVNALYFKRRWAVPFDAHRTRDRDFHLLGGGRTVKVPFMVPDFMSPSLNLAYGFFQDFKVLRVPYAGGSNTSQFSFYIFLPHARDGLEGLIKAFHSDPSLLRHCDLLRVTPINNTWIPKLKFSYGFEAQDVMKSLGLTGMFEPLAGDLSEMVEGRDGNLLYVNRVLHKCCIEVDEGGTVAAAVTKFGLRFGCALLKPQEPPSFVADHPFLFFIREDISKTLLFTGVVLNPSLNA